MRVLRGALSVSCVRRTKCEVPLAPMTPPELPLASSVRGTWHT